MADSGVSMMMLACSAAAARPAMMAMMIQWVLFTWLSPISFDGLEMKSHPSLKAARRRRASFNSLHDIGQKAEKTRALDCPRELPLPFCAHRRDSARNDLAPFGNESRQKPDVLVVDLRCAFARERAALPAPEKWPACLSLLLGHYLLSTFGFVVCGASSLRGVRGGLSRGGPRSLRSNLRPPPKPPRSPPNPRSPPKPPRSPPKPPRSSSRSRERLCRITADGPSSSASTRTVMNRITSSLIDICRSISATAAGGASMLSSE